jgi:CDP-diacylglycerol--glycerol-3-phosphate 3-phosphatidyltransferase
MFFYLGMLNIWILLIVVLRDILVSGIRMYAANKNVVIPANYFGKLKTVSQMVLIIFLYFLLVFGIKADLLSILLQLIVGILTAGSGIKYLLDSSNLFKGDERK